MGGYGAFAITARNLSDSLVYVDRFVLVRSFVSSCFDRIVWKNRAYTRGRYYLVTNWHRFIVIIQ